MKYSICTSEYVESIGKVVQKYKLKNPTILTSLF